MPDLDESGLERPAPQPENASTQYDRINIARDDEN